MQLGSKHLQIRPRTVRKWQPKCLAANQNSIDGFLNMVDPQVTMLVSILRWFNHLDIWGYPHDLGNLCDKSRFNWFSGLLQPIVRKWLPQAGRKSVVLPLYILPNSLKISGARVILPCRFGSKPKPCSSLGAIFKKQRSSGAGPRPHDFRYGWKIHILQQIITYFIFKLHPL